MNLPSIIALTVIFAALLTPVVLILSRIRDAVVELARAIFAETRPISPSRDWNSHPLPDADKSVYGTNGPYDGESAPPSDNPTDYFHRLVARGVNALEAALTAVGKGPILFGDNYPPKRMLEIGMSWVMERGSRDGPTWESRFWLGVKERYIYLYNGDVVREPGDELSESPTYEDRTKWVHDSMRMLYPAWALDGVIPKLEAVDRGGENKEPR